MGDLPLITFEAALEHSGRVVLGGFYRRAAVDGICHCPHHFGIAAEADGSDDAAVLIVVEYQRIRIGRQAHLCRWVIVTQFDQLAIGHSLPDSFLLTKQKKTAITPMSNYGFILVLITFQVV